MLYEANEAMMACVPGSRPSTEPMVVPRTMGIHERRRSSPEKGMMPADAHAVAGGVPVTLVVGDDLV